MLIPGANLHFNTALSFGYHSEMTRIVNNAVRRNLAKIHCAYSGKVFERNVKLRATAEHIKTHSSGGLTEERNLLPVMRKPNNERADEPLNSFIKNSRYDVINNVARTIREVARLRSEKFNGLEWAKQVVKTFSRESGVNLKVNLDDLGPEIFVPRKRLDKGTKIPREMVNIYAKKKPHTPKPSFQEQLETVKKKFGFV